MIVGPEVFSEDGRMIEVDDLITTVREPEPNRVFLAPVGGIPDTTKMPPPRGREPCEDTPSAAARHLGALR